MPLTPWILLNLRCGKHMQCLIYYYILLISHGFFSLISEMQESAALDSNPAVRLVNFFINTFGRSFHKRLY